MPERTPGSPSRCPDGTEDSRIAALLDDPGDDAIRRHVLACSVCAQRYVEHVVIATVLRGVARAAGLERPDAMSGEGTEPGEPTPRSGSAPAGPRVPATSQLAADRRGRWPGVLTRRVPLAAALLIGLAGLAVGAIALVVRTVFVAPGAGLHGRVWDWERISNLRLRDGGFPAESPIDAWTSYSIFPSRVGTAVVGPVTPSRRVAVAGFEQDGRLSWSTAHMHGAGAWPELGEVEAVTVQGIGSVVSRRSDGVTEETLWVLMDRHDVGAIYLCDPVTGAFRGRFVHTGPLAQRMRFGPPVFTLPAADGEPRRLLLSGHHADAAVPTVCVSVIDCDGKLVQHVEFPNLRSASIDGPDVQNVQVDWEAGHESVALQTSEDVIFSVPVVDRMLDVSGVRVEFGSTARAVFDAASGPDSFAGFLAARGGEKIVLDDLASGVRILAPGPQREWRRR